MLLQRQLFNVVWLALFAGLIIGSIGGRAQVTCFFPNSQDNTYTHRLCVNQTSNQVTVQTVSDDEAVIPSVVADLDVAWALLTGVLVFMMQTGFSMLEAGAVHEKNVVNILFKNLMDAMVGAIVFWLCGYAFAYGNEDDNFFIGTANFALSKESGSSYHSFFFQFTFAATAATIVSGSVAERCKLEAYLGYTIFMSLIVYPVVVHWVWDAQGWLSAFSTEPLFSGNKADSYGMIDFAGSGVVHMVGGFAGLVGAIFLGPRIGRFSLNADGSFGKPIERRGHNVLLQALGVGLLWIGWYGFNAGSTLVLSNNASATASKVTLTTTLAASAGGIGGSIMSKLFMGHADLGVIMNSTLGGLVGVTASCAVIEAYAAVLIGFAASIVYFTVSKLLLRFKIDDPVDAFPVHGTCGILGVLVVGIFGTDENARLAGYNKGVDTFSTGEQFGVQVVGALAIMGWTIVMSIIMFTVLHLTVGLRVSEKEERMGLDVSEHGGKAYHHGAAHVEMGDGSFSANKAPEV